MQFIAVHAGFLHPYEPERADVPVGELNTPSTKPGTPRAAGDVSAAPSSTGARAQSRETGSAGSNATTPVGTAPVPRPPDADDYSGDIMVQCERYATFCIAAIEQRSLDFDVIHAHDWMTYPAGLAIARLTGKPLVVHVHSTEFDRSGEHINQRIYDIERRGMHGAMRVITVSQLTKNVAIKRYDVADRRIEVVYNGVEFEPSNLGMTGIHSTDKIVLYFGRITYQKGPEYFIRAAKRVLEVRDDIKFVVAGSGDLAQHMMQMANELGIGHKVLFTGFLRGKDIPRVFAMADLYVMPSISEPFGIAPLEAMIHDVPVLISKSSGVSEVLSHALKVDFWDIDDMANKIVAVLRHPPLSSTLREHGAMEVRKITWDGAATRCEQIYRDVINEMTHPPARVEAIIPRTRKSTKARSPKH
jgi:glycosyltransferase involved in cell wall biosynthesis